MRISGFSTRLSDKSSATFFVCATSYARSGGNRRSLGPDGIYLIQIKFHLTTPVAHYGRYLIRVGVGI